MEQVAIVRCADYDDARVLEAVRNATRCLGGMGRFVSAGSRVVLKPNLLMKKSPEEAVTTHPALVKAVVRLVKEEGGSVTLAESPGGPYTEKSLKGIYEATGMEALSREEGFSLNYDLSTAEVDNPSGKYLKKLTVIKSLADADVIINLPKMKTHEQMVFTGAVKNMFGAIAGVYKAEFHLRMPDYLHFADALIDIFLSVKPALSIMDAVVAMDGAGPASGDPRNMGLLFASDNGFALDIAAVTAGAADPSLIPVIKQAMERKLAPVSLQEIEILGESLEAVTDRGFRFNALQARHDIHWAARGLARKALQSLKPRPHFDHGICVGCGECARACPAGIIEMKRAKPYVNLKKCIRCFCCQELCTEKAVSVKRPLASRLLLK